MQISRRNFLRVGGAGAALGAVSPLFRCPLIGRSLQAAMLGIGGSEIDTDKKLLVIFLRGGMDGLHACIPHGDSSYSSSLRPTLIIGEGESIDLNGYMAAHSAFHTMIDEIPEGDRAWIHAVGYSGTFSRSHFEGQRYWETADPQSYHQHGWVNKLLTEPAGLSGLTITGASISLNHQVAFRGPEPLPHIPNLQNYNLEEFGLSRKLLGAVPDPDSNGTGLLGIYSRDPDKSDYDALVRGEGLALTSSLEALVGLDPRNYVPENGASYRTSIGFLRELRDAVMLLKFTDCMVAGIQLPGFDTHGSQEGGLNNLLGQINEAFTNVYLDTRDNIWPDLCMLTMSEFGRTSAENGARGTDHGEASLMIAAGGAVEGGVYNGDEDTWPGVYSVGRYVKGETYFTSVLAEISQNHFGLDADTTAEVVPGHGDPEDDSGHAFTGFIKTKG